MSRSTEESAKRIYIILIVFRAMTDDGAGLPMGIMKSLVTQRAGRAGREVFPITDLDADPSDANIGTGILLH